MLRARASVAAALTVGAVVAVVIALRARASLAYEVSDTARLRAVEDAETTLAVKVLEARAGLLPHYDPIVRSALAAHDAERFAAELRARGGDVDEVLRALDATVERARANDAAVETLKTDLAILRSSSRYFPVAVAALVKRGDASGARIEALRDDVERFESAPSRAGADRIGADITAVEGAGAAQDEAARADVAVVLGHARAIVERRERVDRIARAIAARGGSSVEEARSAYERAARREAVIVAAAIAAAVLLALGAAAVGAALFAAKRREEKLLIRAPRASSIPPRTRRSPDA